MPRGDAGKREEGKAARGPFPPVYPDAGRGVQPRGRAGTNTLAWAAARGRSPAATSAWPRATGSVPAAGDPFHPRSARHLPAVGAAARAGVKVREISGKRDRSANPPACTATRGDREFLRVQRVRKGGKSGGSDGDPVEGRAILRLVPVVSLCTGWRRTGGRPGTVGRTGFPPGAVPSPGAPRRRRDGKRPRARRMLASPWGECSCAVLPPAWRVSPQVPGSWPAGVPACTPARSEFGVFGLRGVVRNGGWG